VGPRVGLDELKTREIKTVGSSLAETLQELTAEIKSTEESRITQTPAAVLKYLIKSSVLIVIRRRHITH
jgi:predicted transcriptional regulator